MKPSRRARRQKRRPRDRPFPELIPSRLTGAEPVINDGRPVPGLTVLDFWRWAASDLADNVVRGWFAEFIVATALGSHDGVRVVSKNLNVAEELES